MYFAQIAMGIILRPMGGPVTWWPPGKYHGDLHVSIGQGCIILLGKYVLIEICINYKKQNHK